jgi:hypothetical protein
MPKRPVVIEARYLETPRFDELPIAPRVAEVMRQMVGTMVVFRDATTRRRDVNAELYMAEVLEACVFMVEADEAHQVEALAHALALVDLYESGERWQCGRRGVTRERST